MDRPKLDREKIVAEIHAVESTIRGQGTAYEEGYGRFGDTFYGFAENWATVLYSIVAYSRGYRHIVKKRGYKGFLVERSEEDQWKLIEKHIDQFLPGYEPKVEEPRRVAGVPVAVEATPEAKKNFFERVAEALSW